MHHFQEFLSKSGAQFQELSESLVHQFQELSESLCIVSGIE